MASKSKSKGKTTELRVSSVTSDAGVAVGSFFNGLSVPENTHFDLFHNKRSGEYLIHGENDTLDYNGETGGIGESHDYAVAVYDPLSKSVELYKAPLISGRVSSRSKRTLKGPAVKQIGARLNEQRNALGQAFGTKKAKAAITNLERNRIDAEKLQDMELDIVDNVREQTLALPSKAEMDASVTSDKPTPVANEGATSVEDIYSLSAIIPDDEWQYLRVSSLMDEPDVEKRLELLPYSDSAYVAKKLGSIVALGNTEKAQLLYYASLLFGVHNARSVKDKDALMERLQHRPAEALVDGILHRFTVSRVSTFGKAKHRAFIIDPHHSDKIICYLLAVLFHIDNFALEVPPLAHELKMKPNKLVSLCRAMGATIKPASAAQAEAYGLLKTAALTYKIATLRVPFKLPEMTKRAPKRAR